MTDFDSLLSAADEQIAQLLGDDVTLPSGDVIKGTFEMPTESGTLASIRVNYTVPVVEVRAVDSESIKVNDVLVIKGGTFNVTQKVPTGDGWVVVKLSENQPATTRGAWQ